jgi:Mrp family chromosome partitioning ATPase
LFIVPNFEVVHSTESLISPKVLALLDHVKQLGPNLLTIFDMPPITSSDSVLAIAPHVDALLMVVSEGKTGRSLLRRANQMVEDIPRIGTVLNRSIEGDAGAYY